MRAAVLYGSGDAGVVVVEERPVPIPGEREILVRVRASALNRADVLQRRGRYPAPGDSPQDIGGIEFAGEVAARGANALRWREGDRVFAIVGGGAHAEFVTVHEEAVAAIPMELDWVQAGAIPEAFMTAFDALVAQGELVTGESVLVHAIGSGVGTAALQLARALGATVYGTTRSADKLASCHALGLTAGAVIQDPSLDLAAAVQSWREHRGIDVAIDLVGGAYTTASLPILAPRGRIVVLGTLGGAQAALDLRHLLRRRLTVRGSVLRSRTLREKIALTRAFETTVAPLLSSGEIAATIDSTFPLDRIGEAHARLESNTTVGKVVLLI